LIWNINYPVGNNEIDIFERDNEDVSINVYRPSPTSNCIIPFRITEKQNAKHHVDLLLIADEKNYHYVYIKDFGRLMNSQINKTSHKTHYCKTCLHPFKTKENLEKHIQNGCMACVGTRPALPKPGSTVCFKNNNNKFEMPFRIYADFESIIRKMETASQTNERSFTDKCQVHEQCGFTIYVVSSVPGDKYKFNPIVYRGDTKEDVSTNFIQSMKDIEQKLMAIIKKEVKMVMTEEDIENFSKATHCHICNKEVGNDKVRDHCHLSGKFRGAGHSCCNRSLNDNILKYQCSFRVSKITIVI